MVKMQNQKPWQRHIVLLRPTSVRRFRGWSVDLSLNYGYMDALKLKYGTTRIQKCGVTR